MWRFNLWYFADENAEENVKSFAGICQKVGPNIPPQWLEEIKKDPDAYSVQIVFLPKETKIITPCWSEPQKKRMESKLSL